ncbi:MAG: hypothetical protein HKP30_01345, partial [Myxococcales bacterium]|nr:hypothetical protein [Myxococcales bacterium]
MDDVAAVVRHEAAIERTAQDDQRDRRQQQVEQQRREPATARGERRVGFLGLARMGVTGMGIAGSRSDFGAGLGIGTARGRHRARVYPMLALLLLAVTSCEAQRATPETASDGLILVRIVKGSAELVRVRIDDGASQALTDTPQREESWPYWSAVAERLVFQVREERGEADLVIYSHEHGERPLGETKGREERWPVWAPRTAQLAYAFRGGDLPAGLAIGDLETGKQQILARTGDADAFLRPSWAPAGPRLVAQRRLASGGGSRLWLLRPGAEPELLSDDPSWFEFKPHFTRDAKYIVFSRRRAGGGVGQ